MRFDIFKERNIIHGISDVSFNSIAGKTRDRRAKKFLQSCGYKINAKDIVWAEQVFGAKVHAGSHIRKCYYFSHRKRIDNPDFYKEKGGRFASFIGLSEDTNKIIRIKSHGKFIMYKKELIKAVNFIKQGKVLVCPTDTVYGLIADATNKKAVERLFKIKGRKLNKPVPIFVKDINAAKKLAFIDENQEKFLKKVWPGKVTVVLKRKNSLKLYGVDKETIGLRIPKHKFLLSLLKIINKPLTGTSANISGEPASTKIEEVIKQFNGKKYQPDLIIDLGSLPPKSRPSKVIDLTIQPPKVLRAA